MKSQDDRYRAFAVSLVGVLLALFSTGTALAQGYEFPQPCAGIDYFTSNMPPDPEFDIQHIATTYLYNIDPSNHDVTVDMIFDETAFLDSVPPYVIVYQMAAQGMTPDSFPDYYALLDTLVDVGDSLFELTWELVGTANGADTFWTYGLVSLEGCTEFEPLMYFSEGGFDTLAMMPQGVGEGISWWYKKYTKLGTKGVYLDIDISFECNNCRIIDDPPYTDLSFDTGLFWTADAKAIESKYFKPAPCCPEDKVECLKSQVKLAWASGFKSVSVSAKDLSVSVSGHLGCQGQWQKTFRVCCDKETTVKPTTDAGVPQREYSIGQAVYSRGDNYEPFAEYRICVIQNTELEEGMMIPPPVPGTASFVMTDEVGSIAYSDLNPGGYPALIMPEYFPNLIIEGTKGYDMGYDLLVDLNWDGAWTLDEPAIDVSLAPGFTSEDLSVITPQSENVPSLLRLDQNRPNPFRAGTEIGYGLPRAGRVTLTIYDSAGRRVSTLVDGYQQGGYYVARWDGKDAGDTDAAGGVYFYRLKAGDRSLMRKMVYLK